MHRLSASLWMFKGWLSFFFFFFSQTRIGLEKLNTIEFSECTGKNSTEEPSNPCGTAGPERVLGRGCNDSICHSFIIHNMCGDWSPLFFLFYFFLWRPCLQSWSGGLVGRGHPAQWELYSAMRKDGAFS